MKRHITGLFCISILMAQLLAPLLVIVFFAVSPAQALFGDYLKSGQETTNHSFICPMGIEWKNGSEHYIKIVFGDAHENHNHGETSVPMMDHSEISHMHHDHMTHHNHSDNAHSMHHDHHTEHGDKTNQTPEPCPIENILMIFSEISPYNMALFNLLVIMIFFVSFLTPLKSSHYYISRRDLFNLLPPRQAPPVYA